MPSFTEYLQAAEGQNLLQVASLRPTLYVGLGGFGCTVLRRLKTQVSTLVPGQASGFSFLGMDTHPHDQKGVLTLNEYVPLSIGVDPNKVSRAHPRALGWFTELTASYRAKSIQGGADKVKAVGRVALRNPATFQRVVGAIERAADDLAQFRDNFQLGAQPKVYVVSTLAGGTGAGCLLDVLFIVGKYFRDACGADFPYQAILVTPDVLLNEAPRISMPDFYANTYATLKELHHFCAEGAASVISYDDASFASLTVNRTLLPDPLHLIAEKNESGTAVATKIEELADIVVSYLLSEIQTPMEDQGGQPKVQDRENGAANTQGDFGAPRLFSSFGVVRTGLPIDAVERLFALRLIHATLEAELQQPGSAFEDAGTWLDEHKAKEAGTDQLQESVREKVGRDELEIAVDARGALIHVGIALDKLGEAAAQLQRTLEDGLEQTKKPRVLAAVGQRCDELEADLRAMFGTLLRDRTVGAADAFIRRLADAVKVHQGALAKEAKDAKKAADTLKVEVDLARQGIVSATQHFFGRKKRLPLAVDDYGAKLEALLRARIDCWLKDEADSVYVRLLSVCKTLLDQHALVLDTLRGRQVEAESGLTGIKVLLDRMSDINKRGPGNRFSLVNAEQCERLYGDAVRPGEAGAVGQLRRRWLDTGLMMDVSAKPAAWLEQAIGKTVDLVQTPLKSFTFDAILERFYDDEDKKRRVFASLQQLSSPLFPVHPDLREAEYDDYWIIAVNPGLKDHFLGHYARYLPGQGRVTAFFESPYEVILYQLKYGYTIASHRGLTQYFSQHRRLQAAYVKGRAEKRQVRPLFGWPEAADWEDLGARAETEEEEMALRWFVAGRAFNYLYPTAGASGPGDSKNRSFVYSRGAKYYLELSKNHKPIAIGNGLAEAVSHFVEHPDWQEAIRTAVTETVSTLGSNTVSERLEKDYIPVLDEEIEKADQGRDDERATVLRKMRAALTDWIASEFRTVRV